MMKLDGEFSSDYRTLVGECMQHGELRSARGRPHKALFNVVLIHRIDHNLLTGLSRRFAIAELMAYVAGWEDVRWLAHFNKNIAQFSDNGIVFSGAYGPRMQEQIARVLFMLREDPHSRQAVVQIFTKNDLIPCDGKVSKDIPCNTMFQLQVVGGLLNMTIYQRSCDLVWGLPYDHFSFTCLLYLLAKELELEPGVVVRHIANAHVYSPRAVYADEERIYKAVNTAGGHTWFPVPTKFSEFRAAAIQTRTDYETPGAQVIYPMLMGELR